ncbi:MAG: hypothetical protein JWL77_1101, partial [Chthonomonadaceae bacterium]|nr:hypothetical protein [Chthonomonadaceae bacterium]
FFHTILSLIFFAFVIWVIVRLFSGRKGVRYTTYN